MGSEAIEVVEEDEEEGGDSRLDCYEATKDFGSASTKLRRPCGTWVRTGVMFRARPATMRAHACAC